MNLPKAMTLDLVLVDLSGEVVQKLSVDGVAGTNHMVWDLRNGQGSSVASGLYLYRLTAHDDSSSLQSWGKVAVLH